MRIIKIESCGKCILPLMARVAIGCPVHEIKKDKPGVHPNCTLDKYIDIEAIKDLCNQYIGSRNGLEREILAIINQ